MVCPFSKRLCFAIALDILFLIGFIFLFSPVIPFGSSAGKHIEESCLNCHTHTTGFSAAHLPEKIGCAACHLGQVSESEADKAHEGMIRIPGNLSTANQTCGTGNCHPGIPQRVERSLMNTMNGLITVDRFVFGEVDSLDGLATIENLGHTPADKHLRGLCVSCHLGNEKELSAPVVESSRGGGCLACHLNYSPAAKKSLIDYEAGGKLRVHAQLSLNISNDHCFGCHSRSGRISTSYEGWHETLLSTKDVKGQSGYRKLDDGRVFKFISEDVHHKAGMDCIDCHSASEVMGDGEVYRHSEEAVKVRCRDCHFSDEPMLVPYEEMDAESKKIISLRENLQTIKNFIKGENASEAMINASVDDSGRPYLITKNSGKRLNLLPPSTVCTQGQAHIELACSTCHTPWIPQCVGCHNSYDPKIKSYDLLDNKMVDGKWIEHAGVFLSDPPTLGVVESDTLRTVKTFVPGMIMTIDASGFSQDEPANKPAFFRLFAPLEAHTINAKGRNCKSCHNNPLAIGYGRGTLTYDAKGHWHFDPYYENEVIDNLPQDAWIGFLQPYKRTPATRSNARPFTTSEQKRILTVGACLTCHKDDSPVMEAAMEDFEGILEAASKVCVLPDFE